MVFCDLLSTGLDDSLSVLFRQSLRHRNRHIDNNHRYDFLDHLVSGLSKFKQTLVLLSDWVAGTCCADFSVRFNS